MRNCAYLGSPKVSMNTALALGAAMDRAPRPYTAHELAEITGFDRMVALAFLKCNTRKGKISARTIPRPGGGKPMCEYWRGTAGVDYTFKVDDMMDGNIENKLKQGTRPVAWKDGNHTSWSIDETETVATMRGGNVVRLGKLEGVSYSKTSVTIKVKGAANITFRRQ